VERRTRWRKIISSLGEKTLYFVRSSDQKVPIIPSTVSARVSTILHSRTRTCANRLRDSQFRERFDKGEKADSQSVSIMYRSGIGTAPKGRDKSHNGNHHGDKGKQGRSRRERGSERDEPSRKIERCKIRKKKEAHCDRIRSARKRSVDRFLRGSFVGESFELPPTLELEPR